MAGTATSGFGGLSPTQRSLAAQEGSLINWARKTRQERQDATAPARAGLKRSWEKKADPDGRMDETELAEAVARLKKAHLARMARRSAEARAARKRGTA